MRAHRFSGLLAFALALCAQHAWAFLDPPYITPANPGAGDLISVNIFGGGCDFADGGVVWPPPVTQQGSELTVLLTGGHEEDPEFCYFGVGTFTAPIGIYPLGTYTLRVNWRYSTFSGWVTETLGVIPFTVSAAPSQQPIEAPTLSIAGLGVLGLALLVAMLRDLRKRLAQSPSAANAWRERAPNSVSDGKPTLKESSHAGASLRCARGDRFLMMKGDSEH